MKILLLSANIGEIDAPQSVHEQTIEFDYEMKTKQSAYFNDRMASKQVKSEYAAKAECDVVVWIDGCVDVTHPQFIEWCVDQVREHDFAVPIHEDRATVEHEYHYILGRLNTSYLGTRYANERWIEEMAWAESKGAMKAQLVNPRVYIAKLNDKTRAFLKSWWDYILIYTVFDQTQISVMLNDCDLKVNYLFWPRLRNYVKVKPHKRLK